MYHLFDGCQCPTRDSCAWWLHTDIKPHKYRWHQTFHRFPFLVGKRTPSNDVLQDQDLGLVTSWHPWFSSCTDSTHPAAFGYSRERRDSLSAVPLHYGTLTTARDHALSVSGSLLCSGSLALAFDCCYYVSINSPLTPLSVYSR